MIKYFLWICFLEIISSTANNYCGLCKNHTLCEFKDRSPTCGEHVESGITASEAEEIVFLHNLYRSKIANGSVICGSPGPQPPAANMNALTWDENLAKVAQRWADQCNFDHDKCRRDARFQVGQNMYVNIGPATVDWRRAIKSWYSGVLKFNKSTVDSFQSNVNTNSYTQLVWANTRYIGCGRTVFETTSNDQENSLKYDKFISSTINGLKNRATNKQSDTDGAKITRQKRDDAIYFGGASRNEEAARGALGKFIPTYVSHSAQIEQDPSVSNMQNQGFRYIDSTYYPADQYEAVGFSYNEGAESISPLNSARKLERIIDPPQYTDSYQQPLSIDGIPYFDTSIPQQPVQRNYVSHVVVQPERENFYQNNMGSHYSNYNYDSEFSRSDDLDSMSRSEKVIIADELLKQLNKLLDDNKDDVKQLTDEGGSESRFQQYSGFIPQLGLVNYYDEKGYRVARSVNQEVLSDNDDDGDDDITCESEEILEKKSSQQSAAQPATLTRKQILVCNYGPTGNVIDQPIYIKGKLCSECPPNTTCKNGLCSYN